MFNTVSAYSWDESETAADLVDTQQQTLQPVLVGFSWTIPQNAFWLVIQERIPIFREQIWYDIGWLMLKQILIVDWTSFILLLPAFWNCKLRSHQPLRQHSLLAVNMSHLSSRRITSERSSNTSTTKSTLKSQARTIDTKRSSAKCAQEVDKVERVQPPLDFESSDPSLYSRVDSVVDSCVWIERLFWRHGVFLDLEAEG